MPLSKKAKAEQAKKEAEIKALKEHPFTDKGMTLLLEILDTEGYTYFPLREMITFLVDRQCDLLLLLEKDPALYHEYRNLLELLK